MAEPAVLQALGQAGMDPSLAEERRRLAKTPMMLGDIAVHNKMLAWTLLQSSKSPRSPYRLEHGAITVAETAAWELVNLKGVFESGAAGQRVIGRILGTIGADIWIRMVKIAVQRPNFALGSPWKGVWDFFNSLSPDIDVDLVINSFCPYLISPEPTPLQNLREDFPCVCPAGIILNCDATFDAGFTNLRTLSADEIPTNVVITFSGTRLPTGLYGSCSYADLIADLQAAGVWSGGMEPGACCP